MHHAGFRAGSRAKRPRRREAQNRLADRMKRFEIDADKLNLADKLWTAGGEPLLAAVLKVGNDLRQEVNSRSARTQ